MEKDVIDGKLVITNREEPENKTEKVVFAPLQIFALDVVLSTGDGKPKVSEERTTIFKRNTDRVTSLKVASARTLLSEIDRTVGPMPFTLRRFDPKIAKLGAIECVQKELLQSYPSTIEKKGELVSQFKYTVAIMPNGKTQILTGVPLDLTQIKSTCSVKDEMYQKTIKSTIARKK